jgi:hypothetical protein
MEGKLKLHIEFLDGRPDYDEDIPMTYPPGAETAAAMKLLADFNMMGGLLKAEPNEVSLVPIATMKLVKVTVGSIVTGNAYDLANLSMPAHKA